MTGFLALLRPRAAVIRQPLQPTNSPAEPDFLEQALSVAFAVDRLHLK